MQFNIFKEIKVKCNYCGTIVISDSDTKWTPCVCEKTQVMGKSFRRIKGDNFTDLTVLDLEKAPPHKGFSEK